MGWYGRLAAAGRRPPFGMVGRDHDGAHDDSGTRAPPNGPADAG